MADYPRVDAIVLAAGESRRMGTPKALLDLGGETFLERILHALRRAPLNSITVVLGAEADRIARQCRLEAPRLRCVTNKLYRRGQLSSLQVALGRLDPTEVDGFLMTLVDHPLVTSCTIRALIRQLGKKPGSIIVPVYRQRRGHPVLFASCYRSELLATPVEEGARAVVHRHRDRVVEWHSKDPGVVQDIDTPELYREALASLKHKI